MRTIGDAYARFQALLCGSYGPINGSLDTSRSDRGWRQLHGMVKVCCVRHVTYNMVITWMMVQYIATDRLPVEWHKLW